MVTGLVTRPCRYHPCQPDIRRAFRQMRTTKPDFRQCLREAVGFAQIAKTTGLSRQTVYRIKDDAAGCEAALAAWEQ